MLLQLTTGQVTCGRGFNWLLSWYWFDAVVSIKIEQAMQDCLHVYANQNTVFRPLFSDLPSGRLLVLSPAPPSRVSRCHWARHLKALTHYSDCRSSAEKGPIWSWSIQHVQSAEKNTVNSPDCPTTDNLVGVSGPLPWLLSTSWLSLCMVHLRRCVNGCTF